MRRPMNTTTRLMVGSDDRKRRRVVAGEEEIDKKLYDEMFPPTKRVRFAKTKTKITLKHRSVKLTSSLNVVDVEEKEQKATSSKRKLCNYSDMEKKQLWWTRQERTTMSQKSRQMVKSFRKDHMDQVKHYMDVYDHCAKTPSQSSSDYLEQASIVIPTNVRGLEWGIVPSIKAHRRVHVQEILDVQEQIRGRLSAEMRYRVLSVRAMRSSRQSRVMARLMGEGDAASATIGSASLASRGGSAGGRSCPFSSSSARVTTNVFSKTWPETN